MSKQPSLLRTEQTAPLGAARGGLLASGGAQGLRVGSRPDIGSLLGAFGSSRSRSDAGSLQCVGGVHGRAMSLRGHGAQSQGVRRGGGGGGAEESAARLDGGLATCGNYTDSFVESWDPSAMESVLALMDSDIPPLLSHHSQSAVVAAAPGSGLGRIKAVHQPPPQPSFHLEPVVYIAPKPDGTK